MAAKGKHKNKKASTKKRLLILFGFLFLWWSFLTLLSVSINITEGSFVSFLLTFLRIAVPILALIVGVPIILLLGYDKSQTKNK